MEKVSELHIMEHLEANWTQEYHIEPVLNYFKEGVSQVAKKQVEEMQ